MEAPSEFSIALDLYKFASGALDGYWTVFAIASAAVLVLAFTGRALVPRNGKAALAAAYAIFASFNNYLIGRSQQFAVDAAAYVKSNANSAGHPGLHDVLANVNPGPPLWLQIGQAGMALFVLMALFMASRREEPHAAADVYGRVRAGSTA
jgi:hypothetical protein